MEWSGQQSQAPQHAPQPVGGAMPSQQYLNNPLHGQPIPMASGAVVPPLGGLPDQAVPLPVGVAPAAVNGAVPSVTPLVQPAATPAQLNDDMNDVNDAEWVSRAKRTIAGTRGDPHRQVQLIQHLRSQYLKQRYGRTVHTDKA